MKTFLILMFSLTFIATALYASFVLPPYNKSKPPGMSLLVAYERAMAALGSDTNQFHCISASITTDFTAEGEWYFTFCSTNSKAVSKLIAVEFNGKVIFDNGDR